MKKLTVEDYHRGEKFFFNNRKESSRIITFIIANGLYSTVEKQHNYFRKKPSQEESVVEVKALCEQGGLMALLADLREKGVRAKLVSYFDYSYCKESKYVAIDFHADDLANVSVPAEFDIIIPKNTIMTLTGELMPIQIRNNNQVLELSESMSDTLPLFY